MFRLWKVAYFTGGFAPFMDAPDAPGAGGGVNPGDGGAAGDPPAGDIDPAALAAATDPSVDADDDEDDDDLDLDSNEPVTPERWKKVSTKLKKLNRRDRKTLPLRQRMKELEAQGLTLDDLITAHRNHTVLERQIRANPRLARVIYGGDAEEPPPASRRAAPEPEEQFDESKLPFDANENPTNRYFANLAKRAFEQDKVIRQLSERINQADGRDTARTEAEQRKEWKSAIEAAVPHIKEKGVQTLFKDTLAAAYQGRASHRMSPQQVIAHYLKELGVNTQDAAAANAAAATGKGTAPAAPNTAAQRQRIAEQNRTLPRTVAPTGSPAPARNPREKVADVGKRIRQQVLAG